MSHSGHEGVQGEPGFNSYGEASAYWHAEIVNLRRMIEELKSENAKLRTDNSVLEKQLADWYMAKLDARRDNHESRIQNQLGQITAYEFVIKEIFGNGESDM